MVRFAAGVLFLAVTSARCSVVLDDDDPTEQPVALGKPKPHVLVKEQAEGIPTPPPLPHGITDGPFGAAALAATGPLSPTNSSINRTALALTTQNGEHIAATLRSFIQQVVCVAIWVALAALIGLSVYPNYDPAKDSPFQEGAELSAADEIERGHFNCLEDSESCLFAVFCPMLRFADNVYQAGIGRFWVGFTVFSFLAILNLLHRGDVWWGIFTSGALVYVRQQIRAKLHLRHYAFDICCFDWCFVFWCPCCAIAQDARAVKKARKTDCEEIKPFDAK